MSRYTIINDFSIFRLITVYALLATVALVCAGGYIYKNNTSLQTTIDNYKAENVDLKTKLDSAKRAEANANQKYDQVSQLLVNKITEFNELENRLKQISHEDFNNNTSIEKMLTEIGDLTKNVEILENNLKSAEKQCESYKRDLDVAKAALNSCKDAYRKYIKAMNEYIFFYKAPEDCTPPIQGPDSFNIY